MWYVSSKKKKGYLCSYRWREYFTREVSGDGRGAEVISLRQPHTRDVQTVPPFMLTIDINHDLYRNSSDCLTNPSDLTIQTPQSLVMLYGRISCASHRESAPDVSDEDEGVVFEVAHHGVAASKLGRSAVALVIVADRAVSHHR